MITKHGEGNRIARRFVMDVVTAVVSMMMVFPTVAAAQAQPDLWRSFVEKIDVGTDVNVRLRGGERFRATLIGTRDDAVLLQPKTRITVPVQAVPYEAVVRIERRQPGGMGAGKAAAIGVASGAGTFFAILAILFATLD